MTDPVHRMNQVPERCIGGAEGQIGHRGRYKFTANRAVEGENRSIHQKTKFKK